MQYHFWHAGSFGLWLEFEGFCAHHSLLLSIFDNWTGVSCYFWTKDGNEADDSGSV